MVVSAVLSNFFPFPNFLMIINIIFLFHDVQSDFLRSVLFRTNLI